MLAVRKNLIFMPCDNQLLPKTMVYVWWYARRQRFQTVWKKTYFLWGIYITDIQICFKRILDEWIWLEISTFLWIFLVNFHTWKFVFRYLFFIIVPALIVTRFKNDIHKALYCFQKSVDCWIIFILIAHKNYCINLIVIIKSENNGHSSEITKHWQ